MERELFVKGVLWIFGNVIVIWGIFEFVGEANGVFEFFFTFVWTEGVILAHLVFFAGGQDSTVVGELQFTIIGPSWHKIMDRRVECAQQRD